MSICTTNTIVTKTTTIKDIAKALGVSVATVSYSLSGKGNISAAVSKLVRDTAVKMHYQPNMTAKILNKRELKIAIMLSSNPEFIHDSFCRGFYRAAYMENAVKTECTIFSYDTLDEHAEEAFLMISEGGFDGLIISFPNTAEAKYGKGGKFSGYFDMINKTHIPIISLGDRLSELNCTGHVMIDATAGGRLCADMLGNSLGGERRVAVFSSTYPLQNVHREYVEGFVSECGRYGLKVVDYRYDTDIPEHAYSEALKCFTENPGIEGAIVTPYSSFAVSRALEDMGLMGKVRVVGVDVTEDTKKYLLKGLTIGAIYQRQPEQAEAAFSMLVDQILKGNGSGPLEERIFMPQIRTRGYYSGSDSQILFEEEQG